MLDLRRMMLLRDLADLGTVTAVAERRNITGSAVSQQLRVLEEESGALLFRRDGRTLGLTRSGQVLVDHVRVVLGAVDEAMSAVAATRDQLSGEIEVAAFNLGVQTLAAPMMHHLHRQEPELRIRLQQASSGPALRLLRQGEIDVAITCRYDVEAQEVLTGLIAEVLLIEPLVLLAPAEAHLRIRKRGLAALQDEPWVTGAATGGLSLALMRAGEEAGFTPKVAHRLNSAQNICDLAATEIAPALVPRLSVPTHLAPLLVGGLQLGDRTISSLVRTGRQRDPSIALILRTLRSIGADALSSRTGHGLGVAS